MTTCSSKILNPFLKSLLLLPMSVLSLNSATGEEVFSTSFDNKKWDSKDWLMVKSSRWDYLGEWIQKDGCIVNKIPVDATKDEMLSRRSGETYTSMVLNKKFSGSIRVSSEMSFEYRMAPGIIIACDPVKDQKGRFEYREHFEIILYDEGINVWHHFFVDGKQQWRKKAFLKADFSANTKYNLIVSIDYSKKGPVMQIEADGKIFGFIDDAIPREFYIGIVGCEGSNAFYNFNISK